MSRPAAEFKRLIVLCDGTWQNILSGNKFAYPTNVARLSRAIAPVAVIKDKEGKEKEVEQIIFYQPGVGTGTNDKLQGGAYGAGLSANIRAAYGFLAHNYDPNPGDEIFFFGFSRGAYTARSIAGLVTKLGLLTKRGMDYFPEVYDQYYKDPTTKPDFEFTPELLQKIGTQVNEKAKEAIKIVGVFDTVGFHAEGSMGEKIELHNVELSPRVGHAYHALSLDERRIPYKPTLWQWPQAYKAGKDKLQEIKQVWFSGVHSDVGGGHYDPACSDVSLAWMLAQCNKGKKLAFTDEDPYDPDDKDEYYLLPDRMKPNPSKKWTRIAQQPTADPHESITDKITGIVDQMLEQDREALTMERTFERIHRSIRDRNLDRWSCPLLDGKRHETYWGLKVASEHGKVLMEAEPDEEADQIEDKYIGRIRAAPGSKDGDLVAKL
ncbi:hypothetical protein EDD37DRAFT_259442 [Exophiala viscosa]|uniref:T6SS Phospholipase effector Tle1-like catalytic domain-containing protein n=1 Tax=Exophiala viscosa TaxID=2486360 RepID=A0AAN6E7R5_9EURO|nr:hypothetical protein EDD36DRAFT_25287 [Exophiala viscosa]KAI1627358.1 hypothetical protein EDD37DRAFT_259442 [Exophiala viscosa]